MEAPCEIRAITCSLLLSLSSSASSFGFCACWFVSVWVWVCSDDGGGVVFGDGEGGGEAGKVTSSFQKPANLSHRESFSSIPVVVVVLSGFFATGPA